MLSMSKEANINYLAKVVKINGLKKHPNADRLRIAIIDFQEVIVGEDMNEGDICIFFPLESQINSEFLSYTNSYRHSNLNKIIDDEHCGFFEDSGRVRAVKLRGQKSMGYLVPFLSFNEFFSLNIAWGDYMGQEFDTINKVLMLKKYFIPVKELNGQRLGRKPRISRLVEGQVHLHVDTESLLKNIDRINPEDYISITYKIHGTSFWVSNILVKRKLNILEKVFKKLGVKINDTEYDYVYGSRKVVKNEYETSHKEHFYDYDLWGEIKDELKEKIPEGYTLYGECVGYTKGGGYIQSEYDYGCSQGTKKLFIYRITFTNKNGLVYNLGTKEIESFCQRYGLNYVHLFYYGQAQFLNTNLYPESSTWREGFIQYLQKQFLEKDCFICNNKVPEEGIVVRKESPFEFESYKLKSFRFLEFETKLLDEGVEDIENQS